MAKKKVLVLTNGDKVPVIGEQGKFWLSEGRQFRKLSKMIQRVDEVEIPAEASTSETGQENITTKKAQKKKPPTPSTKKNRTGKED